MQSNFGGATIAVTATSFLVNKFRGIFQKHQNYDDIVQEYTLFTKTYPLFAKDISLFRKLNNDRRFRDILAMLEVVAQLDCVDNGKNQWEISRFNAAIMNAMKKMVDESQSWKSDDMYLNRLCVEDILPLMEQHLENILHNHLMKRL